MQVQHKEKGVVMARKLVHLEVKPSVRAQIIKGECGGGVGEWCAECAEMGDVYKQCLT